MEQTKMSLAEALKAELMERYGLREDQVQVQLTVSTTDLELGRKVLADFDKRNDGKYFAEEENCDSVFGSEVHAVYVHRKDGFYGYYINEEDDSDE